MSLRIDKTSRRVGFHKLAFPKPKKLSTQIGNQIPKKIGAIKMPKLTPYKLPKMKSLL